jgi:hypothetical protein
MNGKHWGEDDLLDRLYGVGPDDDHLKDCAECGERWQALLARRHALGDQVEVDPSRLLRQRVAVMDRIERSSTSLVSWRAVVVGFASATAMMLGLIVYHPERPKPNPVTTASSDTQFFSEIYSEMEQTEPRAVKPMRRLFQEKP